MLKGLIPPSLHPGYVSGVWYSSWEGATATSSAVAAVDTLYLHVMRIYRPVRIAQLGARVGTGGAASSCKLAVWGNGQGRPTGVPVVGLNSGLSTVTSSTSALADVTDTDLMPGVYWAGAVFTGTLPTMSHLTTSALGAALSGSSASVNAMTSQHLGVSAPMTFANDIMATDLTSATFTTVSTASGLPVLAFLVA